MGGLGDGAMTGRMALPTKQRNGGIVPFALQSIVNAMGGCVRASGSCSLLATVVVQMMKFKPIGGSAILATSSVHFKSMLAQLAPMLNGGRSDSGFLLQIISFASFFGMLRSAFVTSSRVFSRGLPALSAETLLFASVVLIVPSPLLGLLGTRFAAEGVVIPLAAATNTDTQFFAPVVRFVGSHESYFRTNYA